MASTLKQLRPHRWRLPTDEPSFEKYMRRLDAYFADLELPIPSRELAVIAEVCFDLGETRLVPADREPLAGCYKRDDLILHAIRWYGRTYGDALRLHPPMPGTVVFLRGDIWQIRYPFITGLATFYAGEWEKGPAVFTTHKGYDVLPPAKRSVHPAAERRFDVLDCVVGLPPGLRQQFHSGELQGVLYVFCKGRISLHQLVMARQYQFVEEALGDLSASVHHLVQRPPHTGLAKWAGQQALEKLLKSYLHHAKLPFPKGGKDGHNLEVLSSAVRRHSGLLLDPELVAEAATSPAVRYDASSTDRRQAARAHFAAMDLGGQVATALRARVPLQS